MYSTAGSMLASAVIKLNPIHRRLAELEVDNLLDFFNSDFINPERRRQLSRLNAFMMTYVGAIRRMMELSRQARQDYYALQRQGCFVNSLETELCPLSTLPVNDTKPPILIVPGLNTPPVFFREMHSYFTQKGYHVSVMNLPANGMAEIGASAEALSSEVERLKERYNATSVDIIGHCLGGLIAHYWLECLGSARKSAPIRNLVSLGTGFMGAQGVLQLKNLWIPRNPGKPVPRIFDELIEANMSCVQYSTEVVRHNLITIWDFMVHFRKGLLEGPVGLAAPIFNHIIDDPAIDHLTLALNHRIFQRVEAIFAEAPQPAMIPAYITAPVSAGQRLLSAQAH